MEKKNKFFIQKKKKNYDLMLFYPLLTRPRDNDSPIILTIQILVSKSSFSIRKLLGETGNSSLMQGKSMVNQDLVPKKVRNNPKTNKAFIQKELRSLLGRAIYLFIFIQKK